MSRTIRKHDPESDESMVRHWQHVASLHDDLFKEVLSGGPRSVVWIFESAGSPVGLCRLAIANSPGSDDTFAFVWVHPCVRNQGIARACSALGIDRYFKDEPGRALQATEATDGTTEEYDARTKLLDELGLGKGERLTREDWMGRRTGLLSG